MKKSCYMDWFYANNSCLLVKLRRSRGHVKEPLDNQVILLPGKCILLKNLMGQCELPIALRLQEILNRIFVQRQLDFRLFQFQGLEVLDLDSLNRANLLLLFHQTDRLRPTDILLNGIPHQAPDQYLIPVDHGLVYSLLQHLRPLHEVCFLLVLEKIDH